MFPPIAPLYEAQQHGEESEYSDEGKNDRYREQRCLLSLSRRSRDHRKVSAPKVTKPPVVLPNRNHQSHDAAENQRKAEVARRMGKYAGSTPGVCWMRAKNWTIVKPKPISAVAVRTHDIIVRSMLSRVRSQEK